MTYPPSAEPSSSLKIVGKQAALTKKARADKKNKKLAKLSAVKSKADEKAARKAANAALLQARHAVTSQNSNKKNGANGIDQPEDSAASIYSIPAPFGLSSKQVKAFKKSNARKLANEAVVYKTVKTRRENEADDETARVIADEAVVAVFQKHHRLLISWISLELSEAVLVREAVIAVKAACVELEKVSALLHAVELVVESSKSADIPLAVEEQVCVDKTRVFVHAVIPEIGIASEAFEVVPTSPVPIDHPPTLETALDFTLVCKTGQRLRAQFIPRVKRVAASAPKPLTTYMLYSSVVKRHAPV
jgi:hypothetical protein